MLAAKNIFKRFYFIWCTNWIVCVGDIFQVNIHLKLFIKWKGMIFLVLVCNSCCVCGIVTAIEPSSVNSGLPIFKMTKRFDGNGPSKVNVHSVIERNAHSHWKSKMNILHRHDVVWEFGTQSLPFVSIFPVCVSKLELLCANWWFLFLFFQICSPGHIERSIVKEFT